MRATVTAMLATVGLLLVSCGDGEERDGQAVATTAPPTSQDEIRSGVSAEDCDDPDAALTQAEWTEFCAEPVEGPVSDGPHQWDDGMAAEIVSVTAEADPEYDNPANDTHVLMTVRFTNNGTATFDWGGDPNVVFEGGPDGALLYGINRMPASGYRYDGENDLPRQLVPGTSADKIFSAYMPGTELGTLAFEVVPVWNGPYTPFTFTGVDQLLQTPSAPAPEPAPGPPAPTPEPAPAAPPTEECIGYGCSPEQDAELNEWEREANEGQ